jgi:exonuclease VII small subunit
VTGKLFGVIALACVTAAPAAAQTAREESETRQQRYEIGLLERVLESAVEHGVTVTRDRLQALAQMPTELLLSDNAHARGFRLEGYGVFFDVTVPSFETTLWTIRTLDQNDLGLNSAMKQLQDAVKGNVNAEQALRRVELQVGPLAPGGRAQQASESRTIAGAAQSADARGQTPQAPAPDPILNDPNEAFRTEVLDALKEAMLNHSSSLGIGPNEWLTIAARGNEDRPRLALAPADNNGSRTRIIRLRGSDLAAYLARQITKDEAKQRIDVRVY